MTHMSTVTDAYSFQSTGLLETLNRGLNENKRMQALETLSKHGNDEDRQKSLEILRNLAFN